MFVAKEKKEFTHFSCWNKTFARTQTTYSPIYSHVDEDVNDVPTYTSIEDLMFSTLERIPESSSSPVSS